MGIQFAGTGGGSQGFAPPTSAAIGLGTAFTLSFWIFCPDNAAGSDFATVYYEDFDVSGGLQLMIKQSGAVNFFYRQVFGGPTISITSGTVIDDSAWHFVSFVKRGAADYEGFIDGVSQGTSTTSVTAPTTCNVINIGNPTSSNVIPNGGIIAHLMTFTSDIGVNERTQIRYGIRPASTPKLWIEGLGGSLDRDYSPNNYTSTGLTGLTSGNHAPMRPLFGVDDQTPYLIRRSFLYSQLERETRGLCRGVYGG